MLTMALKNIINCFKAQTSDKELYSWLSSLGDGHTDMMTGEGKDDS